MSNVLIPINFDGEQPTVSARDLHAGLGISERFQSWFNRQLQYGFQESTDYVGCKEFNTLARQELQDYEISVDMAKQICMIQRSEKADSTVSTSLTWRKHGIRRNRFLQGH